MNRSVTLVAGALCLAITSAAKADWEYTRWGMLEHEVFAAAKGRLAPCKAAPTACPKPTEDGTALLYGDYRSGEFDFTLRAYFDNSTFKLTAIGLILKRPELGDKLLASYQLKYGKPLSQGPQGVFENWIWHVNNDNISLALVRNRQKPYAGVIIGPIARKPSSPSPSRSLSAPKAPGGSNQRD